MEQEKNASSIESLEQEKADEEEEGKKDESSCSSEEEEDDDSESEAETGVLFGALAFIKYLLYKFTYLISPDTELSMSHFTYSSKFH